MVDATAQPSTIVLIGTDAGLLSAVAASAGACRSS
jgi:hypothetical protein